jgi:hypothetical protein
MCRRSQLLDKECLLEEAKIKYKDLQNELRLAMTVVFGLLEPKIEDGFKNKLEEKKSFVKCVIKVF